MDEMCCSARPKNAVDGAEAFGNGVNGTKNGHVNGVNGSGASSVYVPPRKSNTWTKMRAFYDLYFLSKEEVDTFINSFELFDKEGGISDKADYDAGRPHEQFILDDADGQKIVDYYGVLNRLCALGDVEKMYIPPVLFPEKTVFENQIIFEERLADSLHLDEHCKALELGCGAGRITDHVQSYTGASIQGLNIDPTQIELALAHAKASGKLGTKLNFQVGNFNHPLPFPDASFDAVYAVQPLTYTKDLRALFKEIYRVLKPGGRCSYLEGAPSETTAHCAVAITRTPHAVRAARVSRCQA